MLVGAHPGGREANLRWLPGPDWDRLSIGRNKNDGRLEPLEQSRHRGAHTYRQSAHGWRRGRALPCSRMPTLGLEEMTESANLPLCHQLVKMNVGQNQDEGYV